MIDADLDRKMRLRKLRADLTMKTGDLKVYAGRLRRAQDAGRSQRAAVLLVEFNKIKSTIDDVKQTIAELEGAEVPA